MNSILMGGLSALFLGSADFLASQSSERINASRALAGMLFVSVIFMTVYYFATGHGAELFEPDRLSGVLYSIIHGIILAFSLFLFFHAMAIGQIAIVSPIMAAHPVFIIIFSAFIGILPSWIQFGGMVITLVGVAIVGVAGKVEIPDPAQVSTSGILSGRKPKTAPKSQVMLISLAASILYAVALVTLQSAVKTLPDISVLWVARISSFITIVAIILSQRQNPLPPSPKWGLVFLIHAILDTGGVLFIMLGTSGGPGDVITVVVASTFPLITVTIAWAILKEKLTLLQMIGALKIFIGVSILAAF